MTTIFSALISLALTHVNARGGGGALNFGICAMCHQKDPTFFRSLSPKDPHFYHLSPNDPLFLKNSLAPKDPDTSLSLKDPSFSHLTTNFTKCWEIFGHFGPESPYFLMHFTERCISLKDPLFLYALSLKDPFFWRNLSPKDPYIWGAWWPSYVTFICECPPPPGVNEAICILNGVNQLPLLA